GGPNLAYEVMTLEAKVVRLQGRLCQSEKMLKDALELSRRDRFTLQAGIVDTSIRLAQIHYYRYELDAAMDSASKCIAYAKSVSDNLALRQGYGIQALIYEIKGDAKLASHLMEKAMSLAGRTHSAIRIAAAEVVAIELALMQRNLRIAVDWAHRRKLNPNEPFSHAFERDCLLLGRIHLAQDKFQQATDLMRSLRPRSEKRGRFESVMKANIIQSAAAYHLGGKDEALPLMEKAVVFAIPEGYIQPFAENAFCIEEMLGSLRNSRHGAQRAFVRKLIEACRMGSGTCDASKSVPVNDFESLTPREALVLKLIANGLTNPEIADYTDVSMSTVKFHINNIYGKLGVKSRMQAIRRAEELNIC
ncbi:MAG: hypothetical protein KJP07_20735, partial [Desulfatitalea sp.]|nr:hypothetical protein [Desulfatitalea sp.]